MPIFFIAAAFFLGGCASAPPKDDELAISAYERMMLEEQRRTGEILSRAALLSAKAMTVYVKTNQAKNQPLLDSDQIRQARFQMYYIPQGMEVRFSLPWDGAPEPIMKSLASRAGYELHFANQRPPISKSVTVSADVRNVKDFFNIIEQQSKGYIKEIVYDDKVAQKKITVYYEEF